jgi:hypothetical protein
MLKANLKRKKVKKKTDLQIVPGKNRRENYYFFKDYSGALYSGSSGILCYGIKIGNFK